MPLLLGYEVATTAKGYQVLGPIRFIVALNSVCPEGDQVMYVQCPPRFFRGDAARPADSIPVAYEPSYCPPRGAIVRHPTALPPRMLCAGTRHCAATSATVFDSVEARRNSEVLVACWAHFLDCRFPHRAVWTGQET